MNQWFYVRGGRRQGPVSFEQLVNLAHTGDLGATDLVWSESLKEWTPAEEVAGLIQRQEIPSEATEETREEAAQADGGMAGERPEIAPGSDPIQPLACLKRGLELGKSNLASLLAVTMVYIITQLLIGSALHHLDVSMGWIEAPGPRTPAKTVEEAMEQIRNSTSPFSLVVSNIASLFLSMGFIRVCLNVMAGRPVTIAMLFGEGRRMPAALAGLILYLAMVSVGLFLLILPGLYLAVRYAYYLTAMVDRNLGVVDAFGYSSTLTAGNRLALAGLMFLCLLICVAGLLAFHVGLLFALPIAWLSFLTAYRWMQFGHRAAMD